MSLNRSVTDGQPPGVLQRGLDVVHAARADDHQQPVVVAVEHRVHLLAAGQHDLRAVVGERQLGEQLRRRDELLEPLDPLIANRLAALRGRGRHRPSSTHRLGDLLAGEGGDGAAPAR